MWKTPNKAKQNATEEDSILPLVEPVALLMKQLENKILRKRDHSRVGLVQEGFR